MIRLLKAFTRTCFTTTEMAEENAMYADFRFPEGKVLPRRQPTDVDGVYVWIINSMSVPIIYTQFK